MTQILDEFSRTTVSALDSLITRLADHLSRFIAAAYPDDAANQIPQQTRVSALTRDSGDGLLPAMYEVRMEVSGNTGYQNYLSILGRSPIELAFMLSFIMGGRTRGYHCGICTIGDRGELEITFAHERVSSAYASWYAGN